MANSPTGKLFNRNILLTKQAGLYSQDVLMIQNGQIVGPVAAVGNISFSGLFFSTGTPQTLTGAGAVNLTTDVTSLVTTGANALTLAAGTEGQRKIVTMTTDGGDGTLTVTNPLGYTTVTFNDVGDTVMFLYLGAKWRVVSNNGATLA